MGSVQTSVDTIYPIQDATIKLSVIIPVYNVVDYLTQCLESVICQVDDYMEIICVDDGSTDGSLEILREYESRYSFIRVYTQNNSHAGIARNKGLAEARGEYVHFLDADDWISEDAYDNWYAIAKEKNADVCSCFHESFNTASGESIKRSFPLESNYISVSSFADNPKYFLYNAVVPWNKIYKRSFLLNNKILFDDLVCGNDRFFYFQVIKYAKCFVVIKEYWMHYRINNSNSLTGGIWLKNYNCYFESFEKSWKLMQSTDDVVNNMFIDVSIQTFINKYHESEGTAYYDEIRDKLSCYLNGMKDIMPSNSYISSRRWFVDYCDLVGTSTRNTYDQKDNTLATRSSLARRIGYYTKRCLNDGFLYAPFFYGYRYSKNEAIKQICTRGMHVGHYVKKYGCVNTIIHAVDCGIKKQTEAKLKQTELNANDFGVTTDLYSGRKLIVSLTSYPGRIQLVHKTIETLLNQSLKPNMVILWLAKEQFPNKENDLPYNLLGLKKRGLSICWCEDIKSYKKLVPALKKYPDDIIVTADDDAYYSMDWLKKLYESYTNETGVYIHCHRITRFLHPDDKWHIISAGKSTYSLPSYLHKLVGVGGVLYPPNSLSKEVIDVETAMHICPTNDDIWFWIMAVNNNVKIKVVDNAEPCPATVEGSQDNGSYTSINDCGEHLFWKDFKNILEAYPNLEEKLIKEYAFQQIVENYKRIPEYEKTPDFYKQLDPECYEAILALWYKKITRRNVNFDKPISWGEKIQWEKIHNSTCEKTRLTDKYAVRKWVEDKIGCEYLVPLLGVWDSFDQIDFDSLPNAFVLKTNHGSGYNAIVSNKELINKALLKERFDKWINIDFGIRNDSLELHYRGIKPMILAEYYLGENITDYKFLCFEGKCKYIWTDIDRFSDHSRNIYNTEWEKQPFEILYKSSDKTIQKPRELDMMIRIAEKLSEGFHQVRVDLYYVKEKIYFGELTFTSGMGIEPVKPLEYDRLMGTYINLSL